MSSSQPHSLDPSSSPSSSSEQIPAIPSSQPSILVEQLSCHDDSDSSIKAQDSGVWDRHSSDPATYATPPASPAPSVKMHTKAVVSDVRDAPESCFLTITAPPSSVPDTARQNVAESSNAAQQASPVMRDWKDFPYQQTDYLMELDNKLGSGCWSDVYVARPAIAKPGNDKVQTIRGTPKQATELTPPSSPVSVSRPRRAPLAAVYAIKKPAMRSARAVLETEATILTYLGGVEHWERYIVPFHGLDTRNGALVMTAMPQSLDSFITKTLNPLPEPARHSRLTSIFPPLAHRLVDALLWLQNTAGLLHSDIKPGNILLAFPQTGGLEPFLADFSAAVSADERGPMLDASTTRAASGGGTWDYLAPELLRSNKPAMNRSTTAPDAIPVRADAPSSASSLNAASPALLPFPSRASDTYALAMTLLVTITGFCPFDAAPNAWLRRDLARTGMAWKCAVGHDQARSRMTSLSLSLGLTDRPLECLLEGGLATQADRWSLSEMKEFLSRMP